MEAHPIPQNVTAFQFKLVGDMTIKQFTYLAIGLSIAYLTFVFLVELLPYLAWPIIVLSSSIGAAFAFLPFQERPLDHWVKAFLKAVFNPTKRFWYREGISIKDMVFKNRLNIFLNSLEEEFISQPTRLPKLTTYSQAAPSTQNVITQAQQPQFTPIPSVAIQPPRSNPPPSSLFPNQIPPVSPEDLKQLIEEAKQAQIIQNQIVETEHELNLIKAQASSPGVDIEGFTKRFEEILERLQRLTTEANRVSIQISKLTKRPQISQKIKIEILPATKKTNITPIVLTANPNVINGITTDSLGSYLEGVIVVAHDKEGLPVRALKTNKLGQFVAATPLPTGVYTMTFEKDNLVFDVLKIELDGGIIPPLNVSAKKIISQ